MYTANFEGAIHFVDSVLESRTATERSQEFALLYMREQQVYAYDRLRLEEKALKLVVPLIADAEKAGDYRTVIEARLTAALVKEKYGLAEKCLAELEQVRALLKQNDLPQSLARYYVRRASYQRIYDGGDSLRYYALAAYEQGKISKNARAVADGVALYLSSSPELGQEIVDMLEEAIDFCRSVGEHDKRWDMQQYLSQCLIAMGEKERAFQLNNELLYELENDSIYHRGDILVLGWAHEQKAQSLFNRKRYKGAYFELLKAKELEQQLMGLKLQQQVQEIETRYDFELKEAELREREQELNYQTTQKNYLLRGLMVALGFAGIMLYQSTRLKRARRKLSRQARTLAETNDELAASLDEQVMLRSELHHRVKNNLQVIISLLNLQENRETNLGTKSTLRTTSERVYSIAAVHDLLSPKQRLDKLYLQDYLDKLCDHACMMWPQGKQPTFALDVENYAFNLDTLVPLGVVLSELLTNSRKNFGHTKEHPLIGIQLKEEDEKDTFTLRYRDNGPGFQTDKMIAREGGLGSYLIRSMARQLSGSVVTYNESGAVTELRFKVKTPSNLSLNTVQNKKPAVQNKVSTY